MSKSAILLVVLGACAVESGNGSPADTNVPRIAVNSLSPSALAASGLTTATLDAASAAAMGQTASARQVLAYAAGCALGADQTVSYAVEGATTATTLQGSMGIAPAWTSRSLTASEAAWVSACVLARVNLTSQPVQISARGDEAGLATTIAERADYQIEEGAFWGNAFIDLGSVNAYACNGVDQAADDSYGDLPLRQCAQPDGVTGSNLTPCGFHYAGLCGSACGTGSPYAGCAFLGGAAHTEVVTSFLAGAPQ
jgi:hypothetical protein